MSLDHLQIVSSAIRDNGIKRIHFFKYGEPFLSPTVYEELKIIEEQNPKVLIIISTNGAAINTQERRNAALLADHIYFSIDGVSDDILSHYQRGGSFVRTFGNMKEVIRLRNATGRKLPFVEWKIVEVLRVAIFRKGNGETVERAGGSFLQNRQGLMAQRSVKRVSARKKAA